MTIRIKWHASVGLVGCELSGVEEFGDDITEQEIEDQMREVVFERFDWNYWPVDEAEEKK